MTPRIFTIGTLMISGAAMFTYYNERNYTPEAMLGIAITKLNSDDPEVKREGFKDLDEALYIRKRVFSGPVGIPVGSRALATKHVMSVLLDNIGSDPAITASALTWILKLISKSSLAAKGQSVLLECDPTLEKITRLLKQENYASSHSMWFIAAEILLQYDDNKLSGLIKTASGTKGLISMSHSKNALAIATLSKIASRLPASEISKFPPEISNILQQNRSTDGFSRIGDKSLKNTLEAVTQYDPRQPLVNPPRPTANLLSILIESLFGSFWGRMMWGISSRYNPKLRELTNIHGEAEIKPFRERFTATRRIGLCLFLLLSFDLFASYYFQFLCGREFYFGNNVMLRSKKEWKEGELTTLYPIAQTGIFTAITVALIHSYRFVMVPLLITCAYNHRDLIKQISGFEENIGKPVNAYRSDARKILTDNILSKLPK